jgi:hypothetical protein
MNGKRQGQDQGQASDARGAPGAGGEDARTAEGPPTWYQPESGTEVDGEQAEGLRDRDADEV